MKMGTSDFIIGTAGEGLQVVDLKKGVHKLNFLKDKCIRSIAYAGNSKVITGTGEFDHVNRIWNDNYTIHFVDIKNGVTRKVADVDSLIYSIKLLSKEHPLALTLGEYGKIRLINYLSNNSL